MPEAERSEDKVLVRTEYRDRNLIRQLPGAKYNGQWNGERCWAAPLSWATCVTLRGLFDDRLEVGPELALWAHEEFEQRISPSNELRTRDDIRGRDELFGFQRVGAAFLTTAGQALLADEMGCGKTIQAIDTLRQLGPRAFPALVVCPNSVKRTWERELARWAPDLVTSVVSGGKGQRDVQILRATGSQTHRRRELPQAEVVVINWEALRSHSRLAGYGSIRLTDKDKEPGTLNEVPWSTVIADECHRAKSPKTQAARALWAIGHQATYRFALTGTPVVNRPDDLWSILHFLAPHEFPAKTRFLDRWALTSWNAFGGLEVVGLRPDTRDEFFKIFDPRFLRRPKEAVLPQLPAKTYQTRWLELPPKQARAYHQLEKQMLAELEDGILLATDQLARVTRLLQFASSYAEVDDNDKLRLAEPSSKIDALLELVDEASGEPLVVFAQSSQLVRLAEKRLNKEEIRCGVIDGAAPMDQRQQLVDEFQEGRLPVLLLTLGAGGEGLTLTRASVAVFLQRSWSRAQNLQAEDRIHRVGQDAQKVEIIDLVSAGTIEERVREVLDEKATRAEEVVRDQDTLRKLFGGEETT